MLSRSACGSTARAGRSRRAFIESRFANSLKFILRRVLMTCVLLQVTGWRPLREIGKANTVFASTISGASVSSGWTTMLTTWKLWTITKEEDRR